MENRAALDLIEKLQHAFGQPQRVQASCRADEVSREMNSKPCEWCDKETTTRCSQCREIHLCSKACMKLIWKEHKRTCESVKQATSTVHALMEDLRELSVETEGQTR